MVWEGLERVQDRHLSRACNRAERNFGGNGDARLWGIAHSADEIVLVEASLFSLGSIDLEPNFLVHYT